jgi:hypothetical protein
LNLRFIVYVVLFKTNNYLNISKESYQIAQKIWSSTDAILLVFAGSAAEFAAIKAVDWLFYTNRLPSAPIDRLFDTARFAQGIFFTPPETAENVMKRINKIHGGVENSRKMEIPNWAYKDVLYMLVDYSERAHKVVFGEMTRKEKEAYFEAAMAVGKAMYLKDLPETYDQYLFDRKKQLLEDYEYSEFTTQLFECYKKALGSFRFSMLKSIQASVLPSELKKVIPLKSNFIISSLLDVYRYMPGGGEKLRWLHDILLPKKYTSQLKQLGKIEFTSYKEKAVSINY